MNWKWPQKPENAFHPWYSMLHRILALPIAILGMLILCLGLILMGEFDEANSVRKNYKFI